MTDTLKSENDELKTALAIEVMHRQKIGAQLVNTAGEARTARALLQDVLMEIRALNNADNKEGIKAKIDSLIGPEPKEPEQKEPEGPVNAK